MKLVLFALSLVFANQSAFATDIPCEEHVVQLAKAYFQVVDTSSKLAFPVNKNDQLTVLSFKNITPGTHYQEFLADIKVDFDPQNRWAPKEPSHIRFKLSGDFECDNLKVISIKSLSSK